MTYFFYKTPLFLCFLAIFGLLSCSDQTSKSQRVATKTFTLSGTITIEPGSNIDADVMSFSEISEQNNNLDTPQLLSNPVTLGGYLSGTEGVYASDKAFFKDTKDFFRVSLLQGQQIRLTTFFADTQLSAINVQLFLRPEGNPSADVGMLNFNNASSQSLIVPQTGMYFIELNANEGSSSPILYTLAISQTLSNSSSISSAKLLSKFVPNEVVVKFRKSKISTASSSTVLKQKHGLIHIRNIGHVADIYKFNVSVLNQIALDNSASSYLIESELADTPLAKEMNVKFQTLQAIAKLKEDENVLFAEPNYIYSATALTPPNDAQYHRQWSLPMIKAPSAWEVSTGNGVVVAVIDSGVDANHLDLMNRISDDGYDFISDAASAGDGDGVDSDPQDLGTFFHGSHVAGIIAAEGNNNIGVIGVAHNATLMPLRVLGINNTGKNSDIANAILYAAGLPNSSATIPSKKADIINMSLGGNDLSLAMESAINAALAEGLIIIAAAGNDAENNAFYPASFDGVISVSAVTDHKTRSTFSNFGDYIDLTAPGGTGLNDPLLDGFQDGILSTLFATEYVEYIGTSMAAPHVSGVVALMKSLQPALDHTSLLSAIESGVLTDDMGNRDLFGFGLINAAKSVTWAAGAELIPTSLNVFPVQLGFVDANVLTVLSLSNPGIGVVNIIEIQASHDWIEVSEKDVDNSGLGQYRVRINNAVLQPNSVDSGEISIVYKENNGAVETLTIDVFHSNTIQSENTVGTLLVSLSKLNGSTSGDVSTQFSLVEGLKRDGEYQFTFFNVPAGEYLLRASTNNDLDSEIFDSGEALGSYPPFAQPGIIKVEDLNLIELDFGVQFQSFVQSNSESVSNNKSIGTALKFR